VELTRFGEPFRRAARRAGLSALARRACSSSDSLHFLLGQAALVSVGHTAYLRIGAYAVVLESRAGIDDPIAQALIAIVVAVAFAVLRGYVSLRASGVYYILSMLAFGQMFYFLFMSLSALGGDDAAVDCVGLECHGYGQTAVRRTSRKLSSTC
jgi:ABC-type branched-subunit amino acid transport system permease subunit